MTIELGKTYPITTTRIFPTSSFHFFVETLPVYDDTFTGR